MSTLYPFKSTVLAPTVRSESFQKRVQGLAGYIFTEYEMVKLAKYLPNIRFVVEEAPLYKRAILDSDKALLQKLQRFVASVYIYDLLHNVMRDLHDRVKRAVSGNFVDTSRAEMGKLVNAFRGYVVVEAEKMPLLRGSRASDLNRRVYMKRIPASVTASITALEPQEEMYARWGRIIEFPDTSLIDKTAKVRVFSLTPENLPSANMLLGGDPSDDSVPARLLQQLASPTIDCSYLSMAHRFRLAELDVDFPPPNINYELLERLQKHNPDGFSTSTIADTLDKIRVTGPVPSAEVLAPSVETADGEVATLYGDDHAEDLRSYLWRKTRPELDIDVREGVRLTTQLFNTKGRTPFHTFTNEIKKFIIDDIIAFNQKRQEVLDIIENWWMRQGAYEYVNALGADGTDKPRHKFFSDLALAEYQLTGDVKCPNGNGGVWYEYDPAKRAAYGNKMPKIVPRRVQHATDYDVRETDRKEMAKLVNVLRGFVAVELPDIGGNPAIESNYLSHVYMSRIPDTVMSDIASKGMQEWGTFFAALTADNSHAIPATVAPYVSRASKIRVFPLQPGSTPLTSLLVLGDVAADTDPSQLILMLNSPTFNPDRFSIHHRDRITDMLEEGQANYRENYGYIARLQKLAYDIFTNADYAGTIYRITTYDEPDAYSTIAKVGDGSMNVPNILHKHLKDDVLNCNRMRRYLLDQIAAWWRRQSAYDLVTGVEVDGAPKSRGQFFADLTAADARLLGHPSKCPEGSGNIYFEYDPSEKHRHGGKMPKQVEPYTKDDAGNLVQNPNAQFVMCAPLKGASPYAQGTGTLPNLSWEDTAGPVGVHYMGSRRYRRKGAGHGGLVVPAIFGVGAAIGTIHFGAAAFPNLFKGRDGKVDRNKVNVGGIVAGALVFLIARYMLSS
eukprot:jgi/Mesvir1/25164/Mv18844-RA.1